MSSSEFSIRRWVATVVVVAAIIGGVALDVGLRHWGGRTVFGAPSLAVNVAHDDSPVLLGTLPNGFSSILKPVLPAVVNISTSKVVKDRPDNSQFFNDPFFRQFFGNQAPGQQTQPRSQRERSLGSGVIVTSDGTIMTNNHVVDGATDIQVFLSDNRQFAAKLIGTDPKTDVAVIKINATFEQFDGWLDQKARIAVTWQLNFTDGRPQQVCHTRAVQASAGGYPALIATQQALLRRLSGEIATAIGQGHCGRGALVNIQTQAGRFPPP